MSPSGKASEFGSDIRSFQACPPSPACPEQGEELEPARKKAEAAGVKEIYIDDLREEFVRDYVFPMFRANSQVGGYFFLKNFQSFFRLVFEECSKFFFVHRARLRVPHVPRQLPGGRALLQLLPFFHLEYSTR